MDSVHLVQCLAMLTVMVQSRALHCMQMTAMDHDPKPPELELELELELESVWVLLVTQRHNLDHQD